MIEGVASGELVERGKGGGGGRRENRKGGVFRKKKREDMWAKHGPGKLKA